MLIDMGLPKVIRGTMHAPNRQVESALYTYNSRCYMYWWLECHKFNDYRLFFSCSFYCNLQD